MQKPKKLPRDLNARAALIVALSTGEISEPDSEVSKAKAKGAMARAAALTPEQRKEIARMAASVRWKKSS